MQKHINILYKLRVKTKLQRKHTEANAMLAMLTNCLKIQI